MAIFVNKNQAANLIGCTRQYVGKWWKQEREVPGSHPYFTSEGKIDISHPVFIDEHGNHIEEWKTILAEKGFPKAGRPKAENKENLASVIPLPTKPKRGRPKKEKEIIPVDSPITSPPGNNSEDEPLTIQKQKLEIEKLKEQRDKLKLDNAKSRAELIERESLGMAVFDYLSALNQNILDIPRSYIDEFEAGVKMGKSKTDLTDILRKPISDAIKSSIDQIKKEIEKYRRAVRADEKESKNAQD